jgi:hypothetical protein
VTSNGTSITLLALITIMTGENMPYSASMAKTSTGRKRLIKNLRIMIISVSFATKCRAIDRTQSGLFPVGADVEHKHPDVRNDLVEWGKWIIDEVDACGFRFDAVKVHFPSRFISIGNLPLLLAFSSSTLYNP